MKEFLLSFSAVLILSVLVGCDSSTTTVTTVDLDSGLIAHYEFEDNANDISGNDNNGTEYGGVGYVDGIIGKAASFDGVDDYIKVNAINMNNNDYTISAWIKLGSSCSSDNMILALPSHTQSDDAIHFDYRCYDDVLGNYIYEGQRNLSDTLNIKNTWSNVVVSKNGTLLTMYLNSKKLNEFQVEENIDYGTVRSFLIGADDDSYSDGQGDIHWFNGLIDDLRIYSRALNESEIKTLYSLGSVDTNGTIIWKGKTYKTVTSPYTGKVWLDRNLGASEVCTDLNDSACYGDYYQWGRNKDGHQESNSTTTITLATDINATDANSSFILAPNSPYDWTTADSNGSLRSAVWSKTDGSSICPIGYRVPTMAELRAETVSASTPVNNNADAFNNFLKLPSAGNRNRNDGSLNHQGSYGFVWSSDINGSQSRALGFGPSNADTDYGLRAYGNSVRCLRD